MKPFCLPFLCAVFLLSVWNCRTSVTQPDDFWNYTQSRKKDLKLSTYITAHTVRDLLSTEEGRRETLSLLRANGISKVYVEVYRSGLTISPDVLRQTVDFFGGNGLEVVGGIATVPGGDFGKEQEGPLSWFNWQNEKTQNDLRAVMENSAPLFDTFIIDDFLCTADTSMESKTAKGDRSWSDYRRNLLTDLSQSVFIDPAKAMNPDIKMIIKFPQWYDRFHTFGYDVAAQPPLFDSVWVGTETRGQYTQRFGFVQPYEGFINYRWLASLSGEKIGGAWFDHGDCDALDFIEQAYQSVLAGSRELVIFNFDSFVHGHPGHHLLRQDFGKLADLAATVARHPVKGPVAYKPANSDAGGDLYLMDYIGMFGISLVPESRYPENAEVVFLPTQAAVDPDVVEKALRSLEEGHRLVLTTGFLANARNARQLADAAEIQWPMEDYRTRTYSVWEKDEKISLENPFYLDYRIDPTGANVLLELGGSVVSPFLVGNKEGNIFVINTHTFSQEDFDAVGEVLLSPAKPGLLEVPESWANAIRSVFASEDHPVLMAPARVTFQELGNGSFVLHNYNQKSVSVELELSETRDWMDGFTGEILQPEGSHLTLGMKARSRIWMKRQE